MSLILYSDVEHDSLTILPSLVLCHCYLMSPVLHRTDLFCFTLLIWETELPDSISCVSLSSTSRLLLSDLNVDGVKERKDEEIEKDFRVLCDGLEILLLEKKKKKKFEHDQTLPK